MVAVVDTGVVGVAVIAVAAAAKVVVIVAAADIAVVAAAEEEARAAKTAKAVDTAADTEAAADIAEAAGIAAIVAGGETITMIAIVKAATKEETNIEPPKRNNLPDNPVSPLSLSLRLLKTKTNSARSVHRPGI